MSHANPPLPGTERRFVTCDRLEVVEERDGQPALIRGHAAVFNQLSEDLGGFREMIVPGAFAESIAEDDIRALFNHDPNIVLGRNKAGTLELAEDARGLAITIKPPPTSVARDLLVSIKRGDISQMSFGFRVKEGGQKWLRDGQNVIRTLSKLKTFDVSPVTFAAYPQTDVGVRSLNDFLDDEKRRLAGVAAVDRQLQELRLLEVGL